VVVDGIAVGVLDEVCDFVVFDQNVVYVVELDRIFGVLVLDYRDLVVD